MDNHETLPVCPTAPRRLTASNGRDQSGLPRSSPTGVPASRRRTRLKAYRQDFDAIAILIAGDAQGLSRMSPGDIVTHTVRSAFAQYAKTHEAATIQRCWSTWNVLCTYLYTAELIASNPMPLVGRPKLAKTLPKALPTDSVAALLAALYSDPEPRRRSDWIERDCVLILTALAGRVARR